MDFSDSVKTGWLESSIEHNPGELEYTNFTAASIQPPGTSITYYLRASDDPNDMGEWSEALTPPCDLTGILSGTEYLQYKVVLTTDDPQVTPLLANLFVHWYYLGLEEDPEGFALFGPALNPSSGNCSVAFSIPRTADVQFSVFDLSGRRCIELQPREYFSGVQQVELPDLPPGIYVLRMSSEEFTDTCRIVRLN